MSKTKKDQRRGPFDPVQTAVNVRRGTIKLDELKPEEAALTRAALRHTGHLRTQLLRRETTPQKSLLGPAGRLNAVLS